jgi:gliding motility-associated-like protein
MVSFIDNSLGAYTWNWNFGDPSSAMNESSLQNTEHQFLNQGEYIVTLLVTNEHGCSDTATKTIIVHDAFAFFIPNAFSPNEDLVNDVFLPKGTGYQAETFKMRVFDRWGKEILYSEDIEKGWDGRDTKSGKVQPQGIYTYLICIFDDSNIEHRFTGTITLID